MTLTSSNGLPRPEEFPVGSVESRAAVRAIFESGKSDRVQLVIAVPRPRREGESDTIVGPWYKTADGALTRTVIVPPGTDG